MALKTNQETKSVLARLLATENIKVRFHGETTAFFDVKNRVLFVPVFKEKYKNIEIPNEVVDMFILHEVGHALFTNVNEYEPLLKGLISTLTRKNTNVGVLTNTLHQLFNIVEDARIEKKEKRKYPGSRRDFIIGWRWLYDNNFFGYNVHPDPKIDFLNRLNIHFKVGVHAGMSFNNEEKYFVKKMARLETLNDVALLVEELYKYIKIKNDSNVVPPKSQPTENLEPTDSDANGSPVPGNSVPKPETKIEKSDIEQKSDDLDDSDEGSDGNTGITTEDDDESEFGDDMKEEVPDLSEFDNQEDDNESVVIQSNTSSERAKDLLADPEKGRLYHYSEIPETLNEQCIVPYSIVLHEYENVYKKSADDRVMNILHDNLKKWKDKEERKISYMVREFQMKKAAEEHKRAQNSKTGVLDTRKLHNYLFSDDLFLRNTIIPEGKNHGFILLLDWSGSMKQWINSTTRQLYSLMLFCRRINVPFEVYLFRNSYEKIVDGKSITYNEGAYDGVSLRQLFSSRMNNSEFNMMMEYFWGRVHHHLAKDLDAMSMTPLNSALLLSSILIERFKETYNPSVFNFVTLTDGEASDRLIGGHSTYSILYDPISKTNYMIEPKEIKSLHYYSGSELSTRLILKVLKGRYPSVNFVSLFLTAQSRNNLTESQKGTWRKEGYAEIDRNGFDHSFQIKCTDDQVSDIQIDENMSIKKISKVVHKSLKESVNSRKILRRFVEIFSKKDS